jgi:acyl-CoA dehydrogenase
MKSTIGSKSDREMEFILSLIDAEQRELLRHVETLCRGELGALDRETGETGFVRPIVSRLAREGLLDFTVPGDYGTGSGRFKAPSKMSLTSFCLIREALARYCPNAELIFTMQGLGAGPISFSGSEEQRRRYLPRIASGDLVAAFALTEPAAGSDVAALDTRVTREGDVYVLDGRKTFISMAPDADLYTVFAKSDRDAGNRGISAFIIEKGMSGFNPGERMSLLAPHPIGEPIFTGCRVPIGNRIGEENAGFKVAMVTFDFFRTTVAACAFGFAQRAFDEAIAYARKRRVFGEPIAEYQATQLKLAAMATELEAARLLTFRAALTRDRGLKPRLTLESSQAKLYATEAAQRIIDQALQIHGGAGVVKGAEVERLYPEIRALRIYEGTSEIQHLVIAGQLLREQA